MFQGRDAPPQSGPADQPAARRQSRIYYGWWLLGAAVVISVAATGARDSFSLFGRPMAMELGRTYAVIGGAWAIGRFVHCVTQPVIGYLFDRFSSRKVILICVAGAGLATVGLRWTSDYWHLVFLFSFVFSIAMGGASLAILWPLAARWFVKRLGLALGMLTAAPALVSTLLAPISGLVLANYGWKDGWLALGAITLFVALPIGLKFLRNWPSDIGLKPDGDPETPPEIQIRGSAPALQRGRFEADRWWWAFRSPTIWFLMPALAVGGFTSSVVSVYVVSFAHEQGYSLTMVSIILLVMAMLRGVGAVAGGWLADRFVRKKVLAAIYLAQGIAFVALAVGSQTLAGLWVFAVVAGLCGAVWMPVAFALVVDVYGLRWLGTIWGIAFLCQQMGNLVGPPLGGLAYDLIGSYALVFVACASMQILASVAVFAINEQKYSARYQAAVGGQEAGN